MVRLARSRIVLLFGCLPLLPVAARAEDFTGFYAGVNAGYGWGQEDTKTTARSPASTAAPFAASPAGDRLPPSASAAAAALRPAGGGRGAPGR